MNGGIVPPLHTGMPMGRELVDAAAAEQTAPVVRVEAPTPVLPAKTGNETQGDPKKPSPEQVERSVARMNVAAQMARTHLRFELQQDTHQVIVRVIRDDTGEVIRQIPPGDLIAMDEQMRSVLGVFFDRTI
ncbi:MAG TPA: flagellar protein FlaG [Alicyclobacillus sp.]|nr:flagellar protein FlaG [Alicyclobacillus sp.]